MKTALCSPLRRAFVFLALSALSAAGQDITCGAKYTTAGTHNATSDLTNTGYSQPCIEVTGLPAYAIVTLNGQGHTLTVAANNALKIHDNDPSSLVLYENFVFRQTVQPGIPNQLIFINNASTYAVSNTYYDVSEYPLCTTGRTYSITFQLGVYHDGAVTPYGCDGTAFYNNTFGDYNANSHNYISAPIFFAYVNNPKAIGNSITGHNAGGTNYTMDDAIVIYGLTNGGVSTGADIENNSCIGFFDSCYEAVGAWSGFILKGNTGTNTPTFFGHFHYTSMDRLDAENNHYCRYDGYSTQPFNIEVDSSSTFPTFFTNNVFKNNDSCSGYPGVSEFGYYPPYHTAHFGTYSNNQFYNNLLGTVAYFDAAAGTIDLGLNRCIAAYPTGAITCH